MFVRKAILSVETVVDVPPAAARNWFLSLSEHPERYRFDTHQGFEFEQGRFGEVGARFRTRERFLCLSLELWFELVEVGEDVFAFRLIKPFSLGIWGRFEIDGREEAQSVLALRIGAETRGGQLFLRVYPVAAAIHRQICREVGHIRQSMERTYQA